MLLLLQIYTFCRHQINNRLCVGMSALEKKFYNGAGGSCWGSGRSQSPKHGLPRLAHHVMRKERNAFEYSLSLNYNIYKPGRNTKLPRKAPTASAMLRPALFILLALCTCTGAVRQFYQDNAFLELVSDLEI